MFRSSSAARPSTDIAPTTARGVTPRVVLLSLLLAALFGYLLPVIDYKIFNTFLGATHLPPGAVGVLLILIIVINPLLRLISKKWEFSREESLTVYICCLFSSLVPGHGAETFVIPNLVAPFYFATRENKWLDWLQPYLKPWLTPALHANGSLNRAATDGWFNGLAPGQTIPWGAWLVPLAVWMSVVLVSYGMMACLSVILRRQWAGNEALAFPLLRLPLEMVEAPANSERPAQTPFWSNQLTWMGFALAFAIQLVNGLNLYFSDVPRIPLELDFAPYFSDPPWNQIGTVFVSIYPIVVGITYLLSSEVAFSLWFGFWLVKLQYIVAYYLGFMPTALPSSNLSYGKSFVAFQVQGAFWMYVALVLWTGREHLRYVVRRAWGREPKRNDERDEMMSYPVAFWGFTACFAILVGFAHLAGVRLDIAIALWITYVVFAIALTRIVVEGGLLFILHDSAPLGLLARMLPGGGTSWLSLQNGLMPASLIQAGFVVHMRGFIMPSFLHAFKLAHDQKLEPRRLGWLLVGVILISVAVSWPTTVALGYQNGGLSFGNIWFSSLGSLRPVNFANTVLGAPNSSPFSNAAWFVVGALVTYGSMLARARLSWFPFHPIGYLMSLAWPAATLWSSILLGWLIKSLILRFGGADVYRKGIPFFLGLALGDVASILLWLAVDGWQGRSAHLLMPN